MATCGYVCPQCEGKGFLADFSDCNWCNATLKKHDSMIIVYHNSRCSKSRDSIALLVEKGINFQIIDYLKTPLNGKELKLLIKKLGIKPIDLVRKGELIYKENYKDQTLTNLAWIEAMVNNPILIERPIIVNGDKAVIGRPAEKVLEIL